MLAEGVFFANAKKEYPAAAALLKRPLSRNGYVVSGFTDRDASKFFCLSHQRLSSDTPCRCRVVMEVAMSKGTAMKKEQKKPKKKR